MTTGTITIHLNDLSKETLKALFDDLKQHQQLTLYKPIVEEVKAALQSKRRQT